MKVLDKAIKMLDSKSYIVYKGKIGAEKFGAVGDFQQANRAALSLAKKLNKEVVFEEVGTGRNWLVTPDGRTIA